MSDEYTGLLAGQAVDGPKCSRMPYWSEMTDKQKIEQLGDVIRMLAHEVKRLNSQANKLTVHTHDGHGTVVTPLLAYIEEQPYWLGNPLREEHR